MHDFRGGIGRLTRSTVRPEAKYAGYRRAGSGFPYYWFSLKLYLLLPYHFRTSQQLRQGLRQLFSSSFDDAFTHESGGLETGRMK